MLGLGVLAGIERSDETCIVGIISDRVVPRHARIAFLQAANSYRDSRASSQRRQKSDKSAVTVMEESGPEKIVEPVFIISLRLSLAAVVIINEADIQSVTSCHSVRSSTSAVFSKRSR